MKWTQLSYCLAASLALTGVAQGAAIDKRQILPCLPYPYCTTSLTTSTHSPTSTTKAPTTTTTTQSPSSTTTPPSTGTTSVPSQPTGTGTGKTTTFTYTGSAGSRGYNVYTPTGYNKATVPLVVVLHGCTQSPTSIAADSDFNGLADQQQFIVAYPSETTSNNANGCWDWYDPAGQSRGSGEPAIIAGIVQQIQGSSTWSIDRKRTYVTGLSAGAAMSVIMGVTYPDIFAAVGVGAGLEYKSATSQTQADGQLFTTGSPGPDPTQQGSVIYQAMGSYARRLPTIVFHGTADATVPVIHGKEVVISMSVANSLADSSFTATNYNSPSSNVTGQVPNGYAYNAMSWNDNSGKPVVEYYLVQTMDHRWSGGSAQFVNGADMYTDPKGPSFTAISYNFFKANPMP